MDESQEILVSSLKASGVSLPPQSIASFKDITPEDLLSICSQSLHLIDDSSSFPTILPSSVSDRFKICTDIASAIKKLGYRGDLSFHQFLYPSDEDSYKLVRFLVERLSKTLEARKDVGRTENQGTLQRNEAVRGLGSLESSNMEVLPSKDVEQNVYLKRNTSVKGESVVEGKLVSPLEEPLKDRSSGKKIGNAKLIDGLYYFDDDLSSNKKAQGFNSINSEVEGSGRQENIVKEEVTTKTLEDLHLEDDTAILEQAVEMSTEDQHPEVSYTEKLSEPMKTKRVNLAELELKWGTSKQVMKEKYNNLEQSFCDQNSIVQEKFQRLEKIELETKSLLSEILERDEEHTQLSAKIQNQPKISSRKSYIQRVTEITRNSRKQDADIERILQETRELQIESNSIQDRLHRTYTILDETVFRDAKNDPVRRQAYRLLTSIHHSFEQISDVILASDRARREAADLEAKLSQMASHSFDTEKLQADLEAIRKENAFLEQQLNGINL